MRYMQVLLTFAGQMLAMDREKIVAIAAFLADQAGGEKYDLDEIEARIGRPAGQPVATPRTSSPRVALLPVRGVMSNRIPANSSSSGFSVEAFSQAFRGAIRDDRITAVVLDVNTPGGKVAGVPEMAKMIFDARGVKPIIAHVDETSASAGFWATSAAAETVITSSGMIGSVGVLYPHDDLSGALERKGVKTEIISAGRFKAEGNPLGPLDDDARAHRQSMVDKVYGRFVADLARNRGVSAAHVEKRFGEGRVVDAEAAVEAGMADSIGTLEDVLARFGVALDPAAGPAARSPGARAFAFERERRVLADF